MWRRSNKKRTSQTYNLEQKKTNTKLDDSMIDKSFINSHQQIYMKKTRQDNRLPRFKTIKKKIVKKI